MMKVKVILTMFNELDLEKKINKWLEENADKKILDIKYEKKSALVIYED